MTDDDFKESQYSTTSITADSVASGEKPTIPEGTATATTPQKKESGNEGFIKRFINDFVKDYDKK